MESKRQRVGEGAAPPDGSTQLADVLSKLTALVTQGAGEVEGLDDLLERLGQLQGKLNGASELAFKAIEHAQARLQVGCPGLRRCDCRRLARCCRRSLASFGPQCMPLTCLLLAVHAGRHCGAAGRCGPADAAARLPPSCTQRRRVGALPAGLLPPPQLLVLGSAGLPAGPAAVFLQAAGAAGGGDASVAAARLCP